MRFALLVTLAILASHAASARAVPPPQAPAPLNPSQACEAAIGQTEQKLGIARGLLAAIGMVESGRLDPALHRAAPWPWIINVAGEDHVFSTKSDAVAAVRALQAQGVQSIDVGCVQINLMWHPAAFASLDDAFDPQTNVAYGGQFLKALYTTLGDWQAAAGAYHSQTPTVAEPYRQRVLAVWTGGPLPVPPAPVSRNTNADVYGAWPPPGAAFAAMPPANFAFRCCGSPAR